MQASNSAPTSSKFKKLFYLEYRLYKNYQRDSL
nr:MAG TPA: hypothetical protein [Caudoviricetes sp.]